MTPLGRDCGDLWRIVKARRDSTITGAAKDLVSCCVVRVRTSSRDRRALDLASVGAINSKSEQEMKSGVSSGAAC
jgi:hypothetical protein